MNDNYTNINQNVDGDNNNIAARDINIVNNEYKVKPLSENDNPNLITCKSCPELISIRATKCPHCGHDYERDRLIQEEHDRQETKKLISKAVRYFFILIFITAYVSHEIGISWGIVLGVLFPISILVWIAWPVWMMQLKEWWKNS
jgi:ribosomal protein L40E